jgi:hypothetical protein
VTTQPKKLKHKICSDPKPFQTDPDLVISDMIKPWIFADRQLFAETH